MAHSRYASTYSKKHRAEAAASTASDYMATKPTTDIDRMACLNAAAGDEAPMTPAPAVPVDEIRLAQIEARRRSHTEWCRKNYARTRDNVLAASKRWRDKNRERLLADSRRRYQERKSNPEHVERRREQAKKRYRDNKSGVRDKTRAHNKTVAHRYCVYRAQAKRSGRTFNITREQFAGWFFADACSYCGTARVDPDTLGVDRFDNDIGYEPENCRACCSTCNYMKADIDMDTFLARCRSVCTVSMNGPPTLTTAQEEALPITRKDKGKTDALCQYRYGAAKRGYEFVLGRHDFMRLIDEPCHYCWTARGGVDRVNNTLGYRLSNCVPCCGVCNRMKGKLAKHDFVAQCAKIIAFYPTTQ
ncbi:hypothetical protein psal_cds_1161 [Pandoravirus salinus]|uniref:HNH nuclease domain-containing protein n=1 Tax=Pandoravirus salinus TaxID=1349410 RepID=S4W408_9VIRU|nr:RRM superfamily incomplete domain [Pandoravirus salinus]AGO85432.1 hypothetical protein psal_cds_1161 [Pandoravirus salinus]